MFKKYFTIIKQALKLKTGKAKRTNKKPSELDFLPAYLEIMERPPSSVARFFIYSILALCLGTITWSVLGKVDIIASSSGQLMIKQRSKTVQASADGEVTHILIKDGYKVRKNETLVMLNSITAQAEANRLEQQIVLSDLNMARLNALLTDTTNLKFIPPKEAAPDLVKKTFSYLLSEHTDQQAKQKTYQTQLDENIAKQKASQAISEETQALLNNVTVRYKKREKLSQKGNYPKLKLLELKKELISQRRELVEQSTSLSVLRAQEKALQAKMLQQKVEWRRSLMERIEKQRISKIDYEQELIKAKEKSRLQTITAPVSGIVQELSVHTIGGVVTQGQSLMVIVPDKAELTAEVKILNKDKGFIKPGQQVEIKVDSFPYTKYGTIKGEVTHISQDSINDDDLGPIFTARIKLAQSFIMSGNNPIPLTAGLHITAEIRTGERRIIEFLLSPIQEYASTALNPR